MKIVIRINYHTSWGENLYVCGSSEVLGNWDIKKALAMQLNGHGEWETSFDIEDENDLQYKFFLKLEHKINWEFGSPRTITFNSKTELVETRDFWRTQNNDHNILYRKPFTNLFFKPSKLITTKKSNAKSKLVFSINEPKLDDGQTLAIIGNQKVLGNWTTPIPLNNADYPHWSIEFNLTNFNFPIEYKYVKINVNSYKIENWEEGDERKIFFINQQQAIIHYQNDEYFQEANPYFRAAGVAVPIFSLRSKEGFGVGEFKDLKKLIDWAAKTNQKLIQVLPINETIATNSWLDSYPYKAISIAALHPMYLNLELIGNLENSQYRSEFNKHKTELNKKPHVDYEQVMELKIKYLRILYQQNWNTLKNTKAFKNYFTENENWLIPYAAFCYFRDKYKTSDFKEWGTWSTYKASSINKIVDPKSKQYKDIAFYYFIQFHLHQQLNEAVDYAHENNIILKGDLPIGISRHSVDAWISPELFNFETQIGAPPDSFAVLGQNWEFASYNWKQHYNTKFKWWKDRLGYLNRYFDAYRMNHLLAYFRIWEIPKDALHGLLGYFNPALPFTTSELEDKEIWFDIDRFTKPYIRSHTLKRTFGEFTDEVKMLYLNEYDQGCFELKKEYATQRAIYNHFTPASDNDREMSERSIVIRDGLINLLDEVLFIKDPYSKRALYHPRIQMQYTNSFNELDHDLKEKLDQLYVHYYYERNEEIWKAEALNKLPKILDATSMLPFADDSGMHVKSLVEVMDELNILSQEIQRVPKNPDFEFTDLKKVPYLSVSTTSTHDMKTLRGWWEENRTKTQLFFNQILDENGEAPYFAEPWICRKIILQHLKSNAMFTIFPIQDLLAMDGDLRWDATDKERINVPSDIKNRWRYRMIQDIDELNKSSEFNEMLRSMIIHSQR